MQDKIAKRIRLEREIKNLQFEMEELDKEIGNNERRDLITRFFRALHSGSVSLFWMEPLKRGASKYVTLRIEPQPDCEYLEGVIINYVMHNGRLHIEPSKLTSEEKCKTK
jgi:hypothetical protein